MSASKYVDMTNEIRAKFNEDAMKPLDIKFDNDTGFEAPDATRWAALTILPGEAIRVATGTPNSNRYRYPGVAILQIMVPLAEGEAPAWEIVDRVRNHFNASSSGTVVYRSVYGTRVGRNGKWWQVNAHVPFYSDDLA